MSQYTMDDFVAIIKRLRDEDGCPWDRAQTHLSLRSCMMEEAAELLHAIRIYEQTDSAGNMQEELGDILLQVVMHSVIAQEEGLFTLEDVVDEVSRKMIHRHPHVFADEQITDGTQQLKRWEELKIEEKEGKDWVTTPLRDIPMELPALTRATKVCKKAHSLYGQEYSYEEALQQMEHALWELKHIDPQAESNRAESLLGQMLLAQSKIAAAQRLVLEQKLNDTIDEIIEKYEPQA